MEDNLENLTEQLLNATALPSFFEPRVDNHKIIVYISILYIMGVVFGSLGNVLVFLLVCIMPDMKKPIYLLIGNLAIADWLITFVCLPLLTIQYLFYWPGYPYPHWVCKLLAYLIHSSGSASVYTLLAITYNRFIVICYPFKRHLQLNRGKTYWVIVLIWLVSLGSTLPSPIVHMVGDMSSEGEPIKKCHEAWSSKASENGYLLYRVVSFVLFVILIVIFYFLIGRTLVQSKIPGQSTQTSQNSEKMRSKSNRKVIKMMVVICVFFVFCWLPYMVNKLFVIIKPRGFSAPEPFIVTGNLLAVMNSVINPYLYLITQKFRVGLAKILSCRVNREKMHCSLSSIRARAVLANKPPSPLPLSPNRLVPKSTEV